MVLTGDSEMFNSHDNILLAWVVKACVILDVPGIVGLVFQVEFGQGGQFFIFPILGQSVENSI